MRLAMQPIKPRKNFFDYRLYEPEIRAALEDTGDVFVEALDKVVADWEHQPDFKKRMTVKVDEVYLDVYATGENALIFKFVDEGTKAHPIRAKRKPRLAFNWAGPGSYAPRTTTAPSYGGPGKSSGPLVMPKEVQHPGTKPRKFIATLVNANKDTLTKAIAEAIREAQR